MLEESKSLDHTFSVGDQVFDLLSQQMVTILKITLVKYDADGEHEEERQSAKCMNAEDLNSGLYGEEDFFVVTVDAEASDNYSGNGRIFGEFCLPEAAERYRGWDCMPSLECEIRWPTAKLLDAYISYRAGREGVGYQLSPGFLSKLFAVGVASSLVWKCAMDNWSATSSFQNSLPTGRSASI